MTQARSSKRSLIAAVAALLLIGAAGTPAFAQAKPAAPAPSAPAAAAPAPGAAAAPSTASQVEEIKALVEDGSAEYALGHFREALHDFEKAYKLRRLPKLLFNIAQCHRQLKEFDEAAVTLRSFLRLSDVGSAQAQDARELLAQIEEALKAQNKAQVAPPLDDNGRDSPPKPPVIVATVPPPPVITQKPAPLVTVETKPAAARSDPHMTPAPPVAIETPAPTPKRTPVFAWVAGGAGVAALGAGAVFGLMSKSTGSSLTSTEHTQPQIADMQSKLATQATTANVLFVAGGVLVAVSAAFFVFKF